VPLALALSEPAVDSELTVSTSARWVQLKKGDPPIPRSSWTHHRPLRAIWIEP
jgi:hypothetical protein